MKKDEIDLAKIVENKFSTHNILDTTTTIKTLLLLSRSRDRREINCIFFISSYLNVSMYTAILVCGLRFVKRAIEVSARTIPHLSFEICPFLIYSSEFNFKTVVGDI